MNVYLWLSSLRYLKQHPWQLVLSVLGVAIGVAVIVAIDLANQSAKRAFALSTDAVAGKATHLIVGGPSGLPESLYRDLRVSGGIRSIAPVVEGFISVFPKDSSREVPVEPRRFRLMGIDPLAEVGVRSYFGSLTGQDVTALITEPATILLSVQAASSLQVRPGDELVIAVGGVEHEATLIGLIRPSDEVSAEALADLVVADIATAQELLGSRGRLSRIDLVSPEGIEGANYLAKVETFLPPGAAIERSSARSESVEQLTRAFDINLNALSLLALVVGTFLIYNTVTFSVVRRRRTIGMLRAIGVTKQEIFSLILGEALLIGLVSAALGVLAGVVLARVLVGVVTQTINDLFFVVSVGAVNLSPWLLAKGAFLGVAATLVAALVPALEATSVPPGVALLRSTIEARVKLLVPKALVWGALALAVGFGLLLVPGQSLILGFGGLLGLVLGLALLVPVATVAALRIGALVSRAIPGLWGAMAIRGVSSSLSRTMVAITALTVAVSITVGIGTMVQSFRGTVDRWLTTTLGADIYVSPASLLSGGGGATLLPEVYQRLVEDPGIRSAVTFRSVEVDSSFGKAHLMALGTSFENFNRPQRFKAGHPTEIWENFQQGDTVIVSEPFAYHNQLEMGSTFSIRTDRGDKIFRVSGIYYDYSSSRGVVMVSRPAYLHFWDDDGITSASLHASEGEDVDVLVQRLHRAAGHEQELYIRSNQELRRVSLAVFDRSFIITSVMQLLTMVVAFVGVLGALMSLQLERTKEMGTLRALGFTPNQIWGLITAQTGIIGFLAGLFALPMGLILAMGLVFVVNQRSFGWSMDMHVFPLVLVEAVALSVGAALLAGIYPAMKMAASSPAEALREE